MAIANRTLRTSEIMGGVVLRLRVAPTFPWRLKIASALLSLTAWVLRCDAEMTIDRQD
ncbi:hypothetical protein [Tranquillimonas rosea]|uniref:hypothetical protein n=1 Tax=Tranquillimonas rosea TaxID=641238 RepID=UPI003BAA8A04